MKVIWILKSQKWEKLKRYIALLRGINISGRNIIAMSELKTSLDNLEYKYVITYLNSGNVAFSTDEDNMTIISDKIKSMIFKQFNLDIPVLIILQSQLEMLLKKAPEWWGTDDKEI